MKHTTLSTLGFLLAIIFVLSACSPVRIAKIEKRKYLNGYHVQMKQKRPKAQALNSMRETAAPKMEFTKKDDTGDKSEKRLDFKNELKEMKEAVKAFKKKENRKALAESVPQFIEDNVLMDTKKNQASVPSRRVKTNKLTSPTETQGILGVLFLLIGLVFLVLFLLVGWALVIVIAVAVVIGIVLSIILKALGLIGN